MRNVNPIDVEHLSAAVEGAFEAASPAAEIVKAYLERPLEEIEVLVSLLGMARKLSNSRDRFGYDPEYLDEVVLRRVRKLVRACNHAVIAIVEDDEIPAAEDFGCFED